MPRIRLLAAISINAALAGFLSGPSTAFALTPPAGSQATDRTSIPLSEISGVDVAPSTAPSVEQAPEVRALCESARTLIEDGRLDEATTKLNQALAIAKTDYFEPRYLMGLIHLRMGRPDEARVFAEAAIRIRPDAADARTLMGQIVRITQSSSAAIPHFRAATLAPSRQQDRPSVTQAWYQLAESLAADGYTLAAAQALERFDEAIWETNPEHRSAAGIREILHIHPLGGFSQRAELLRKLGKPRDLLSVTSQAVERWPDDSRVGFEHAVALRLAGKSQEAFEFCRARMTDPKSRAAYLPGLIEAAADCNALDAWVAELAGKAQSQEEQPFLQQVVRGLIASGHAPQGLTLGRALAKAGDTSQGLSWDLADAQLEAGGFADAAGALAEFIRRQPATAELSQRRLTNWMQRAKSRGVGAPQIAELQQAGSLDYAMNFVLALASMATGASEQAEQFLAAAVAEQADFTPAVSQRGQLLLGRYDWPAAKKLAEELILASPNLAPAHALLGHALSGLDENSAATEAFRRAIKLAPAEDAYITALAQHALRTGDYLQAQRYFAQALEIEPGNAEAQEGLIDAYTRDDKWDLAREQFERMQSRGIDSDVDRRVSLVVKYRDELFGRDGMAALKSGVEQHPRDARLALLYSVGLLQRSRADDAAEVLSKLLALEPEDYHARMLFARVQSQRLEYDETISTLQTLAQRFPNRGEVLEFLAESQMRDFRVEEGRATLDRLIEKPSASAGPDAGRGYRMAKIRSYFIFNEVDKGIAEMDALIAESPAADELPLQKLALLDTAGRHEEAFKLASELLEKQPTDPTRRELYLRTAQRSGNVAAAIKQLEDWADDPNPGARMVMTDRMIRILVEEKDSERAYKVARDYPNDSLLDSYHRRRWLGWCHAAAGKFNLAIEEFVALQKDRQYAGQRHEIWDSMVEALTAVGQTDAALEQCDKWLSEIGEGPAELRLTALDRKRRVLADAGYDQRYAEVLTLLHAANPTNDGLNNDLGYTWVDLGIHLDKALPMVRYAVASDPLNAAFLDSLGWAFYKSGDFEGARKYLGRAVRLRTGSDPVLYDHLADADWRADKRDEAKANWIKAQEVLAAERPSERRGDRDKLAAAIKAKLAAVQSGEAPRVAPTAVEQNPASQPN